MASFATSETVVVELEYGKQGFFTGRLTTTTTSLGFLSSGTLPYHLLRVNLIHV